MTVNILIADDEIKANSVAQKSYKNQIGNANIVEFAGDGKEAIQIIEANKLSIDLILVDLIMSPMGGIELIDYLVVQDLPIKIIAISAYISFKEIEDNFQNNKNVLGFLEKPFDINKINEIIESSFSIALPNNNFDYSQFDVKTSVFVREQTEEIRGLMRKTAQGILDIGQKLLDIKEKLGHGNFSNWLKTEFNWSEPTAQRFMQVARQFKSINLMNLEIAPSALYILSAPSTPNLVREEAIARAQAGESITYTAAKQIKQEYQSSTLEKAENKKRPKGLAEYTRRTESPLFGLASRQVLNDTLKGSASQSIPLRRKTTRGLSSVSSTERSSRASGVSPEDATSETSATKCFTASQKVSPLEQPRRDRSQQDLISDKSQSETTERSQKPEIVAIIHQPTADRAKTVVRSDVWYKLGQHLLYCGEPNSLQFRRKLPPKASLNIAFPPTSDWRLTTPIEADSELVLFSRYQDVDLITFKEMIQRALELYTEEKELIVFSYLPEPELLILADRLGCLCFIVEPDVEKCEAIINLWKKSRFSVKDINSTNS